MRPKRPAQKRAEALGHDVSSWDEYVSFSANAERGIGLVAPPPQTVAAECWVDHEMRGSFEFYGSKKDIEDGFPWSYEVRFTLGDLEEIGFLGVRNGEHDLDHPSPWRAIRSGGVDHCRHRTPQRRTGYDA